jgi:acyl-CoA thioesterase-2
MRSASRSTETREPPANPLARLLGALDLEPAGRERFLARTGSREGRTYGGLTLAQAVVAASRTISRGHLHSLHAYFLRPGRPGADVEYRVERLRDGRSFHARRVVVSQDGELIATVVASFTHGRDGITHQDPMPAAPAPQELADWEDLKRALGAPASALRSDLAMEARVCEPLEDLRHPGPARWRVWLRPRGTLPDDPVVNAAFLVFVTDRTLLRVGARPHGPIYGVRDAASLDHAVWIHRPIRFDDWVLYCCESPAASAGRSLGIGAIYALDGTRLATVAQEGILRF